MGLPESWHMLIQQFKETDTIQWLAVALGMAEVWLAKSNKIWLYPTGIASTLLSIYILLSAGLYAECLLNGYYVVMSVYGWWYWVKKKHLPPVSITRCSRSEWLIVVLIAGGGSLLLYFLLKYYTNSSVPLCDAWVSATAWAGMWLLAKRKIENWILWIIGNIISVPLYFAKGYTFTSFQYIIFTIIAIFGYIEWKKTLNSSPQQS